MFSSIALNLLVLRCIVLIWSSLCYEFDCFWLILTFGYCEDILCLISLCESSIIFNTLLHLGILCGLCCLRATTWWWRRWGKEATIDWGPPACMSRIIHFLGKEKKNLIDIVSMKVPSAPLSKNVSSAVRRTIGWQGNGRCGLNETVLIEIRTSVGFATVQTPWPCHR